MDFKDIMDEWQVQFPILSPYTPRTLFAKADIMLIGLRLAKDSSGGKKYSVCMQILPLWVPEDKVITPFCEEELYDDKGLQISLEYKLHDLLLKDYVERQKKWGVKDIDGSKFKRERERRLVKLHRAFEFAHQRFGAVLQEEVGLRAVLHLIDSAPFLGCWSMYSKLELKLALAYYFSNENLISQVKMEIEESVKDGIQWSNASLDHRSIEEWKNDLYRRMEDREACMRQVEQNMSSKRISRLKPIHVYDDVGDADLSEPVNILDDLEQLKPLLQKIKRFFGFR